MSSIDLKFRKVSSNEAPMNLLLEADPSESKVREYLSDSYCFQAEKSDTTVGVYILRPLDNSRYELMNIAVSPELQNQGIGSELLHHAICSAKELGAKHLEVGTGSFGYQLAFYQKAGFRVSAIEKDFFLRHSDQPIYESGIQLKDMIRLSIEL
ncbi:MAG: GNAT family N-acetyltransferase [Planctomycetes bacterium]|nr:GNAT family N-acetyltransferase [Planctomycetota bacterium]